jgi:hypothetical protein
MNDPPKHTCLPWEVTLRCPACRADARRHARLNNEDVANLYPPSWFQDEKMKRKPKATVLPSNTPPPPEDQ